MSKKGDFLTGFSGNSEHEPLTTPSEPVVEEKEETSKKVAPIENVNENKRLADKIVAEAEKKEATKKSDTEKGKEKKPAKGEDKKKDAAKAPAGVATRPKQNANAIIKAPEHTVKKDDTFHKRKMVRYGVIGGSVLVGALLIFFLFRMFNSVEIRNFEGETFESANTWALGNGVSLERESEYSLEHAEGIVIGQSREAGRSMLRTSVLTLTVSQGPDMNEVVELPDFEEMTAQQIRTWRIDYQMLAINVRDEASEEVDQHAVIRVNVPNDVDVENFRRSDSLTIYVSSGPETVELNNFRGQPREQVESWMAENPLAQVEFEYEASETVAAGTVLRQSHAPNSNLPSDETLTITLSGGPSVIVPNFSNGIFAEIMEELPVEGGLNVIHRERLSATVPYGRVISQSVAAGEEVFGEEATVIVITSLGRPWIRDLLGTSEGDLSRFFFDNFVSRGANITFTVTPVDSYQPRGQVVSHSHEGQFLGMTDTVNVRVSRGNLTPPEGDFDFDPGPGDDE